MGALAKINRMQVMIIGIVLSIIAAAGIYIGLIKPLMERKAEADAKYEAQKQIADQMPSAQADRKKAEQEVRDAKRDWAVYERRLMPTINLSNLFTAQRQLWNEQINVLGPKVVRYLNADRRVRVVSQNISLPAPPSDPNAVAQKIFTFPLGQVSVAGTFNDILKHAERWNDFDRLVLVDGLTLSGNSPGLVGTYSLTAYIITQSDEIGPSIPQAQPATGGFGGGFGGPPGGFPGGPPPGAGGPPPGFGGPGGAGEFGVGEGFAPPP
jgi:Predicted membrane protein